MAPGRWSCAASLMIACCLLASCGRLRDKADFVFINGAEPETLDPAIISGQPDGRVANALFEGLLARNAQGDLVEGMAGFPKVSADGKTYTFTLRDGARWNNGDPVTAHDFVYSWERVLNPSLGSVYAELLFFIDGAENYLNGEFTDLSKLSLDVRDPLGRPTAMANLKKPSEFQSLGDLAKYQSEIETEHKVKTRVRGLESPDQFRAISDWSKVGVRALDDRTLEVRLKNPTPFFPELVAFTTYFPVHRPTVEKYGMNFIKAGNLVSNGAYSLSSWFMNDHIRLVANPHYWRSGYPKSKVVDVIPTDQGNTAFNLFYTGKGDLVADKGLVPAQLIPSIRNQPWFHLNPMLATFFIRFNVTKKPFDDLKVRRALSLAIDRDRIVKNITRNGEPIARSITPPGVAGGLYSAPAETSYDPESARRFLAEAGYPEGRDFPTFSLLYNSSDLNKEICIEIQRMWERELGVVPRLEQKEWKVYLSALTALNFDAARSSWVGDYNDPNTFLDCFVTDRGNNRTGWSNAEYDALIDEANRTLDPPKRMAIFQRAEKILLEQAPIIPLYYFVGVALYDPEKLGGFEINLLDEHPLREIYVKDPHRPPPSALPSAATP